MTETRVAQIIEYCLTRPPEPTTTVLINCYGLTITARRSSPPLCLAVHSIADPTTGQIIESHHFDDQLRRWSNFVALMYLEQLQQEDENDRSHTAKSK